MVKWTPQLCRTLNILLFCLGLPWASVCNAGDLGSIPGLGRPLGEGNGNRSSILAWRIPWTEEPGQLETTGLQRVRHNWAINTFIFTYTQNPYTANSYTHACLYKHTCTYWTPGTDSRPPVNLKSIKCWLMLKPLRLFFLFFFLTKALNPISLTTAQTHDPCSRSKDS